MKQSQFDLTVVREYLDRQLDAVRERKLEEAMLLDPALADLVQAEMALRHGFREVAVRDRARPVAPVAALQSRRGWGRPRRWVAFAAAAALAAIAVVPAWVLVVDRGERDAMEARLAARIEASGQSAAYALPASFVRADDAAPPADDDVAAPVRIRLPDGVRDVVLELPTDDFATPGRMILEREGDPGFRLATAGSPVADAGALGFRVGSDQVPPGRYRVTVERETAAGWVATRSFDLTIDPAP